MKKLSVLFAALLLVVGLSAPTMADLSNGTTLDFFAAPEGGIVQPSDGTGSWFSMLVLDLTLDTVPETNVYTPISSFQGIIIGILQPASGSHPGAPNDTENPSVDNPWSFFANTGMHQVVGIPVTDNGDGTLDFSGWSVTWNGIPDIPVGGDPANFPEDTALAAVTVSGSNYTLDYSAHVPLNSITGFGGVLYSVHLEGIIDSTIDDSDGDGVPNFQDNCPFDHNPDQADTDGDDIGDACDVEECDGLDNDGDGFIDEDLTRESICGVGACLGNIGLETCTAGNWGDDTCDPMAGASPEICDEIDNDCDGLINEDLPACSGSDLPNGTILDFFPTPLSGIDQPTVGTGSWFSMLALDLDFDTIPEASVYTPISSFEGIILGQLQPASGSHSGVPNGPESPSVDNPWSFFTNTGMHQILDTPVTDLGGGLVDFSGWSVTWNGIPDISMGGDPANFPEDMGAASIVNNGSSYTLDYSAHVPLGDVSGFGGVLYSVHLEGNLDNPIGDNDGDGIQNADDNCPFDPNPDQADTDEDGIGNACDVEECDGLDNDGDGLIDEDLTRESTCGVGACAGSTGLETCTAGNWDDDTCDPLAGASPEICDEIDNDCDGSIDEGVINACGGCGPVPDEVCDGIDNNCDGEIDEGFADSDSDGIADCVDTVIGIDNDGDGHGSIASGGDDCDDTDPSVFPGAFEIPDNGIDDNCDGEIDNNVPPIFPNGTTLSFAPPGISGGIIMPTYGSWFSMLALDLDLDLIPETSVYTPISSFEGIILGQLQPASVSHSGVPNGTESPSVDNPWSFFTNTGMHQIINTPVTDMGGGVINFSGWSVTWNGIPDIPMGGDPANFSEDTGIAAVTVFGSNYTLDYSAHVPLNSVTGFGGVLYSVHLEGTFNVPGGDSDGDGVQNADDNCPSDPNSDQADTDGDGIGDACDAEECDGLDNDGNGLVDEGFDSDGDGIGDCFDTEECDGLDNNGDGQIDEGFPDTDSDGTADCIDTEECDGLDNDGDGQVDEGFPDTDSDGIADCVDPLLGVDDDGDGYGSIATGGEDCDDTNPYVYPGAPEIPGNGIDDNCDGEIDNTIPPILPNGTVLNAISASNGGIVQPGFGSWFSMLALDLDLDQIPETSVYTPISSFEGIILGQLQPASGSHSGYPDGSESPSVDNPWSFFANTGMHQVINLPVTDIGGGFLDMRGWSVTWNGIPDIPMGGDPANFPEDTGLAVMTVSGSSYTLDYSAHVPLNSATGFGGVLYGLHFEGDVVVPFDSCDEVRRMVDQACPVDGEYRNHAQYMRCAREVVKRELHSGFIDRQCVREIMGDIRRSNVGK